MSAAGPKESVESVAREPDLDIYDKLRRFDEKLKELEARLAPRVPSNGDRPPEPQPNNPVGERADSERERSSGGAPFHYTACQTDLRTPEDRAAFADILAAARRHMDGNAAEAAPSETRECEGCGQRKPLDEMAVCFLPGTGESYQCEQCRGAP